MTPLRKRSRQRGLHWEAVRRIERARLERELAALPVAQPTRIVMDEFALFKGHRHATVVLDADAGFFHVAAKKTRPLAVAAQPGIRTIFSVS